MGHWGCLRYIYMASARDQGCEYGNQLYVSFGLGDRYLILIVTSAIEIYGTCHINGLINPKTY